MNHPNEPHQVVSLLANSLRFRSNFFDSGHETAFRLFNGFAEGYPNLLADLYSRTLILYNYSNPPEDGRPAIQAAKRYFLELFPWLKAIIVKTRKAANPQDRRGRLIHGDAPDRMIKEAGVLYSVDLLMNQDSSFYLDTRELRAWAIQNLAGKRVLNTFAYTGSLGVAALAGGASSLVQLDKSRKFVKLAELSYELNGLPSSQANTIVGDYYSVTRGYRLEGRHFDCVFLDPPFFSTTARGKIDVAGNFDRVLNKVRPLVAQDGILVAINNAIYVSGADYFTWLERLCSDGYLSIESLIPVPLDITGYPETIKRQPPVNPAPFNHSTKIALLRVSRK